MNERLLQYIWQFQYFNRCELRTTDGDELMIIDQGRFNRNQGPDFLEGRIKINDHTWVGHIELHVHVNDWYRHMHHEDAAYANVVLHVVWNSDVGKEKPDVATLVLEDRVPGVLLRQYTTWMNADMFIPCQNTLAETDSLVWVKWKETILAERLHRRSEFINEWLVQNRYHWEETMWWVVARSFGLLINADAFAAIAMSIPLTVLLKHHGSVLQLEALLLGQAGLLTSCMSDAYSVSLWREYDFLRTKYLLRPVNLKVLFLRMRPSGFPTVRLAQLATMVNQSGCSFTSLLHCKYVDEVASILDVTASEYWDTRYMPGEEGPYNPKKLGRQMVNSIVVNGIIPFLYTYGDHHSQEKYMQKAVEWLQRLAPEKNKISNGFARLGVTNLNAADTQSLLELKSQYCDNRRCLDCAVGVALLRWKDERR